MIYTEPFVVTGGGPGNSTTFLSIDLVKMAVGQFDLGPAAAMSIIYFLIILLLSWVFYTVMTNYDAKTMGGAEMADATTRDSLAGTAAPSRAASDPVARSMRRRGDASRFWWLVPTLYILFLMLPIYWLVNMSFKTNQEILGPSRSFRTTDAAELRGDLHGPSWYKGYINSIIYVVMNTVISVSVALPAATRFRATASSATSTCSSGF